MSLLILFSLAKVQGSNISIQDRRLLIYNLLHDRYMLDRDTSLAILANLEYESVDLDPKARQRTYSGINKRMSEREWWSNSNHYRIGRGTGLAQWDGCRRYALRDFAKSRGMELYSIETQIAFIVYELTTTEKAAYRAILMAKDVYDKVIVFATKYERSGILNIQKRISKLKLYMERGLGYDR